MNQHTFPSRPLLTAGRENDAGPHPGVAKAAVTLGAVLCIFAVIELFVPLGTAIQIGADEGFNMDAR